MKNQALIDAHKACLEILKDLTRSEVRSLLLSLELELNPGETLNGDERKLFYPEFSKKK